MNETNASIKEGSALDIAAHNLLKAAYEFWLERQKSFDSGAVVWLKSDSGHLVVFTRGEYEAQLMQNIAPIGFERRFDPYGGPEEAPNE